MLATKCTLMAFLGYSMSTASLRAEGVAQVRLPRGYEGRYFHREYSLTRVECLIVLGCDMRDLVCANV